MTLLYDGPQTSGEIYLRWQIRNRRDWLDQVLPANLGSPTENTSWTSVCPCLATVAADGSLPLAGGTVHTPPACVVCGVWYVVCGGCASVRACEVYPYARPILRMCRPLGMQGWPYCATRA